MQGRSIARRKEKFGFGSELPSPGAQERGDEPPGPALRRPGRFPTAELLASRDVHETGGNPILGAPKILRLRPWVARTGSASVLSDFSLADRGRFNQA